MPFDGVDHEIYKSIDPDAVAALEKFRNVGERRVDAGNEIAELADIFFDQLNPRGPIRASPGSIVALFTAASARDLSCRLPRAPAL
jgi:hypothetical protein